MKKGLVLLTSTKVFQAKSNRTSEEQKRQPAKKMVDGWLLTCLPAKAGGRCRKLFMTTKWLALVLSL
ncbi:MAG: hypothetical protein NTX22_09785 [Ignavibacteriales bacterium]|nr:hypothetical protein [Ignavibacteriales bacterium]